MPRMAPYFVILALLIGSTQAMRTKIRAKSDKAQELQVGGDKKSASMLYLSKTLFARDAKPPGHAEEPPDYAQKGKCCQWKDYRDNGKVHTRWFYRITESLNGTKAIGSVGSCPSKWYGAAEGDYSCNGMPVYNLVGYVEDTDWVVCCKAGSTKERYVYFTKAREADTCHEKTGWWHNTCYSYQCEAKEHIDVDQAHVRCPAGYQKIVNADPQYGCATKRPTGFTDIECAGYSSQCSVNYCKVNSIYGRKGKKVDSITDCSDSCELSAPSETVGN